MKGIHCGGRLLAENLERCRGVGARGRARIILEQAYGKKSRKTGRSSWIMPSFLLVMVAEFASGKIFGVGRRHCAWRF